VKNTTWLRITGRIILIIWAGFWVFFAVATILSEPFSAVGLLSCIFFSLMFVISALIPLKWESVGTYLLIIEGVIFLIVYPLRMASRLPPLTILFMILTLAIPPLTAGILLLMHQRRMR